MTKDTLIKNLHKLYREDPWINELFNSAGITLDKINAAIEDLENQYWFDTMTWAIPVVENMLQFKTDSNAAIEDRRSQLEARWKSNGKADIYLLQAVANSWRNGDVTVSFVNGKIKVTFVGEFGVPKDLEGLEKALEDVKPAHLALVYSYRYLLIKEIDNTMTLSELEQRKLNEFAGGELIGQ
ncbi:putative phage tail protein [Clostridium magnum]|uniref:DUF2313 domain-containing protein n=1 Tax=Clostridium magnum DSM 2767 TaxID=1121326 RepID=A0A168E1X0_9CLOT|nr:putative phage tail protein [Clostridium magnum]KZL93564.1 hypothetical protein CLMAG_06100 [Clostridium magnum DSM 2767]SHI60275.1 hypothetical protein SAMN02745944_04566 [Clostridium magnum DSM 2767]